MQLQIGQHNLDQFHTTYRVSHPGIAHWAIPIPSPTRIIHTVLQSHPPQETQPSLGSNNNRLSSHSFGEKNRHKLHLQDSHLPQTHTLVHTFLLLPPLLLPRYQYWGVPPTCGTNAATDTNHPSRSDSPPVTTSAVLSQH